ncbi:unnamed protein product [Effrenium voratum]|uniref:Uncharacterized protein n=1 Tax=Effrenium voratum TaxID=2562239 RepID=A0AA36MU86_9DINO|nr:unnamed protein product [Effrenium voratum]
MSLAKWQDPSQCMTVSAHHSKFDDELAGGLLDLGGGARGESIGELKLPVGRRLACGQGGEGAEWVQLHGEGVVKGSLLLELSCAGDGRSPAKLPAPEPAKLPAPAPALPPAPPRREPERPEQKVWEELPEASPAQEPGGAKPPPASWRLEALEALEASLKTKESSKVQAMPLGRRIQSPSPGLQLE